MKFIIVTGLSGAGKSQAVRILEDIGYYCIDNIPPALLTKFAEICLSNRKRIEKIAFVTDIRGGDDFSELSEGLKSFKDAGYQCEILFLEASFNALVKRYKETRRRHPLSEGDILLTDAINKEIAAMEPVRKMADRIVDTTNLKTGELKKQLVGMYVDDKSFNGLVINVVSFGFKNGILIDADLVFDVRFLPNPFYIDELKSRTGKEAIVRDYVMGFQDSQTFLNKLSDMLEFLIPQYIEEGKNQLVIGIGCTGGKHRSVTIAEELYKKISNQGYYAVVNHRDILK